MRFLLSALLVSALCLPVLAQKGESSENRDKEIEKLKATIQALEQKLRAVAESKKESKVEVVVVKEGEKKPEPKKDGERKEEKPELKREERKPEPRQPEGPGGPRFGGGVQGGFSGWGPGGFGPPIGGMGPMRGGQPGTPPGFERLTADEQATFRKLMEKMADGRSSERRLEGGERRPEGSERRPNVEERLERLERAIEEIRRGMQGPRGERR
ncbi:MAG: hypothetical protein MUF18_07495 [Fimbriiglobus sp.]|nr:hypothetical protein [Fimbriiglobus sp.]